MRSIDYYKEVKPDLFEKKSSTVEVDKYTVDDILGELFHLQDYELGDLELYSGNSGKRISGIKLDIDDSTGKVKRVIVLEDVK